MKEKGYTLDDKSAESPPLPSGLLKKWREETKEIKRKKREEGKNK